MTAYRKDLISKNLVCAEEIGRMFRRLGPFALGQLAQRIDCIDVPLADPVRYFAHQAAKKILDDAAALAQDSGFFVWVKACSKMSQDLTEQLLRNNLELYSPHDEQGSDQPASHYVTDLVVGLVYQRYNDTFVSR